MSNPIKFYYTPGSAPCRAVLLTAAALGLEMDLVHVDLMNGAHLKPEFLKINPIHCVPTIEDNGFCLWESRAIMQYLVNKYAKDESLYPKCPQKRALVDLMMNYDLGTLYASCAAYYYPKLFAGAPHSEPNYEKVKTAVANLNTMLEGRQFAAGGQTLTIADLTLAASISTMQALDFDFAPYRNITGWLANVQKTAPNYAQANDANLEQFKQLIIRLTKKN